MPARTTPPPAARARPQLLERDHELQAVAAARRGAGRVIVVRAPPEAGKTGLIAHARGEAARAGLIVLEARGAELEQGFAFGAVRRLLEPVVVGLDEDERAALLVGAAALAARSFDAGAQDESGADVSFATLHGLAGRPPRRQRARACLGRRLPLGGRAVARLSERPGRDASRVATLRAAAPSAACPRPPPSICGGCSKSRRPRRLAPVPAELGRHELAAMQLAAAEEHRRAAVGADARWRRAPPRRCSPAAPSYPEAARPMWPRRRFRP